MVKMHKGNNYIQEKTGSATKINQSGQPEYEFGKDGFPSGINPKSVRKGVTKLKK
ncbi:MAG: hypothetical protein ACOX0T_12185 [Pelotomaculum sp.]